MSDYPEFLNGLLEAERAGAKLLAAWVARRIAAALPGVPAPQGRRLLAAMHKSHLAGTPQQLASSNAA